MTDIMETITMIQDENLDIRTITMGISLLDCCDSDIERSCEGISEDLPLRKRIWSRPAVILNSNARTSGKVTFCVSENLSEMRECLGNSHTGIWAKRCPAARSIAGKAATSSWLVGRQEKIIGPAFVDRPGSLMTTGRDGINLLRQRL